MSIAGLGVRGPARRRIALCRSLAEGLNWSLKVAALVVAVAVGVHRLRGATEGGQRVNCSGDVFYLVPRQFASTNALQDSIVVIHSGLSFLFLSLPSLHTVFYQTSSVIPVNSSKMGHGSKAGANT